MEFWAKYYFEVPEGGDAMKTSENYVGKIIYFCGLIFNPNPFLIVYGYID
jgi:hypothetical protein